MKKLLSIAFILTGFYASAQQDLTLYHMRYVPQSSFTNAAFTPEAKVYVGIPAISGIYFGATNSGFKWKDLVKYEQVADSFNLKLDVPGALGKMNEKNLLSQELRIDLLNLGFKIGNNHIAFNVSSRQKFSFAYTRDMFALLFVGNGLTPAESQATYGTENYGFLGETADLSGTGLNFTQFTEIGVKYSRTFLDKKLSVGLRPKVLLGSINLQTKRTDLTLSTDAETFALSSNGGYEINTNFPAGLIPDSGSIAYNPISLGNNIGFGIDLGMTYLLSDKFEISAAINDLGFISWKGNPKNYNANDFQIDFKGISGFEDDLLNNQNATGQTAEDSVANQLNQLRDTLLAAFTPDTTFNPYSTGIGAKFNLGARYAFTKRQSVAVLLSGQMIARQFKPAVSLSYNFRLYKWLGATAAYNTYNGSYTNLGVGLSFNIFPVQFHFITDNIFALSPASTRYVHARFGMNLVFGHDKKANKEKRSF
jgi:hypothetical protein